MAVNQRFSRFFSCLCRFVLFHPIFAHFDLFRGIFCTHFTHEKFG